MLTSVVILIGILAMSGLLAPVAHAGASASAPSKYAQRSQQVTSVQMVRQAKRTDPPITEFSAQAKTAPFHR